MLLMNLIIPEIKDNILTDIISVEICLFSFWRNQGYF